MYNSDSDLRKPDDYGVIAANYYGTAPKDNLRNGSKSSVSKFSFMTKRERIPGLDGAMFLPAESRSVAMFQLQPRVTDHYKEDIDNVPDDVLYSTEQENANGQKDSKKSHSSNDNYLDEIDREYKLRAAEKSPFKQQDTYNSKFQENHFPTAEKQKVAVNFKKENRPSIASSVEYDPYVDIDLMTYPPVYAKLLKEGCMEDVAEQFLGLVQDDLLGNVEWDSEHGENLLKSVSRKSQREEDPNLKEFFDEFRSVEMNQSADKFHLFKKMCQLP